MIITLFLVFSMVASSLTLSLGTILGGEKLYELTNSRIFRNPKSLFDTTPIGRILNRVTQDIDTIDNSLPSSISSFIQTTVSVNSDLKFIQITQICFVCSSYIVISLKYIKI